jgi:hypothetical protein
MHPMKLLHLIWVQKGSRVQARSSPFSSSRARVKRITMLRRNGCAARGRLGVRPFEARGNRQPKLPQFGFALLHIFQLFFQRTGAHWSHMSLPDAQFLLGERVRCASASRADSSSRLASVSALTPAGEDHCGNPCASVMQSL